MTVEEIKLKRKCAIAAYLQQAHDMETGMSCYNNEGELSTHMPICRYRQERRAINK